MILVKNLPFNNVVAAGIATLSLPLGMTFERIVLELGGGAFTKAMITLIECKLNGKTFFKDTGSRCDLRNTYRGLAATAAYLTLDFSEAFARDEVDQRLGSIGTLVGVSSFTIEVTIAGATTPTLASYSWISSPKPLGVICKSLAYSASFAAAGKFNFPLPFGSQGGSIIKRINLFHAQLSALEIKKNGLLIWDNITPAVNNFLQTEYRNVPQAGLYVYDPILDHNVRTGALVTADAQSFEMNPTLAAADTLNVYVEYLDTLGNL